MGCRRGQAYSQDLRDRVLAAAGEPIRSVAARLAVSPSYVSKVQSKFPALCSTRHRGLVRKDAVRFYHFGRWC